MEFRLSADGESPQIDFFIPVCILFEHKPERFVSLWDETPGEQLNAVIRVRKDGKLSQHRDELREIRESFNKDSIIKLPLGIACLLLVPMVEPGACP